jgi:hypothetical protein
MSQHVAAPGVIPIHILTTSASCRCSTLALLLRLLLLVFELQGAQGAHLSCLQ